MSHKPLLLVSGTVDQVRPLLSKKTGEPWTHVVGVVCPGCVVEVRVDFVEAPQRDDNKHVPNPILKQMMTGDEISLIANVNPNGYGGRQEITFNRIATEDEIAVMTGRKSKSPASNKAA